MDDSRQGISLVLLSIHEFTNLLMRMGLADCLAPWNTNCGPSCAFFFPTPTSVPSVIRLRLIPGSHWEASPVLLAYSRVEDYNSFRST